jgi:hypothetical protein
MMAMASSVPGSVSMITFLAAVGADTGAGVNGGEPAALTAGTNDNKRQASRNPEILEVGPKLRNLPELHGEQKQQC